MRKITSTIIALLILTSCTPSEADFKSDIPVGDPIGEQIGEQIDVLSNGSPIALPSEINLNVPFYPQAPDADWGMPWQEACEEASIVLAYYYAIGQDLTKEKFKEEIHNLVDWQNENFGDYEHTDIDQTSEMLKKVFKFSSFQILENLSVEEIKQQLAQGNVIIAPFAGRQLGKISLC